MINTTFGRRASMMLAALTLACGDSTAPRSLSEEQVGDLLEAMDAVSFMAEVPGAPSSGAAMSMPALRLAPTSANATMTVSQTVSCPRGGSASVNGSLVSDEAAGTLSLDVTQAFADCAASSKRGRVWTFDGSIVSALDASFNKSTGAFSLTATRAGTVEYSSDLGSGSCAVDLTLEMSGVEHQSVSMTLNGTACGHSIQQTIEVTQ